MLLSTKHFMYLNKFSSLIKIFHHVPCFLKFVSCLSSDLCIEGANYTEVASATKAVPWRRLVSR